jgi:hypothetical protein
MPFRSDQACGYSRLAVLLVPRPGLWSRGSVMGTYA